MLSHDVFLFSLEMRANACARKKRNSTPELWRPCRMRSGYGDEWITRVKTLRQVRDTENMRKHIFWSGYWLLGRFRAKNGGSQEPAKRRTFPIFAGTPVFLEQDWRSCSGTWNHLNLRSFCLLTLGKCLRASKCPNLMGQES